MSNVVDTRGTWTREESSLHINFKELLAASFAVKAFTKELQYVHLLIQIDNTTTVAYINKMGVPKGVSSIIVQDTSGVGVYKGESSRVPNTFRVA